MSLIVPTDVFAEKINLKKKLNCLNYLKNIQDAKTTNIEMIVMILVGEESIYMKVIGRRINYGKGFIEMKS